MTSNDYPVYKPGQTLTATELNRTTTHLIGRDRLLGRLIGFGINSGLGGMLSSQTKLTIERGLAIDQAGQGIALLNATDVPLPPTAVTPSYDFIDATPGGFSIVLEATDTPATPPPCGEANCGGHPEIHTTGATLRVVAGRIKGTWMDFASESLLSATPMRFNPTTGKAIGSYQALRDKLATRLTNNGAPLVESGLIALLKGTEIKDPGDLPAAVGYKCGWLNMVLFATLDLLRCEALCELSANRSTTRNGVVLGWVHQVSGAWVFDCAYRHAWEPPRGFTEAFLGGTCADPCALYRSKLEAILGTYAPPKPPASGGGVTEPPVIHYCPHGEWIAGKCRPVLFPPKVFPEDWRRHWLEPFQLDPKDPIWNPPREFDPRVIYETDVFDYLGDGYLHGGGLLGFPGGQVRDAVVKLIADHGGKANVILVKAPELNGMPGYAAAGGFSPSDTIVFTVDAENKVIGTGRIAAIQMAREMTVSIPTVMNAANLATAAAADMEQALAGFEAKVGGFDAQFTGFTKDMEKLHTDFAGVERLSERLVRIEGSVDVLSRRPAGSAEVLAPSHNVDFARAVAAFADTTLLAIGSMGDRASDATFKRQVVAAEKAKLELDQAVGSDDSKAVNVATVKVLGAMSTMLKGSGANAVAVRKLDVQMRELRELIK